MTTKENRERLFSLLYKLGTYKAKSLDIIAAVRAAQKCDLPQEHVEIIFTHARLEALWPVVIRRTERLLNGEWLPSDQGMVESAIL